MTIEQLDYELELRLVDYSLVENEGVNSLIVLVETLLVLWHKHYILCNFSNLHQKSIVEFWGWQRARERCLSAIIKNWTIG